MNFRLVYCCIIIIIASCKNDLEVVNSLTKVNSMPDISGENVEIIYTDSSTIKLKMVAPLLLRFNRVKEPYYEFPKGLHVYNYDRKKQLISDIVSDYAIYYELKKQWLVKKNVIAHNFQKNEQLNTEELIWDEGHAKIYSDKFVRITNSSGIFYGEKGFEADQDMNRWKLIGSKGTLHVKNKE